MTGAGSPRSVWEDDAGPPAPPPASRLAPLRGELRADVCVVGLGGSGLTAVSELRAHGVRVVGLDAGQLAAGAAGRNGGFLLAGLARPHHDMVALVGRDRAAALHRLTLQELVRVEAVTPQVVRRTGSLRIEDSEAGRADCAAQAAALAADGFAVSGYDGPEGVGLLFPDDGVVQPLHRCWLLAAAVTDPDGAGPPAVLHGDTPVLTLGRGVVGTASGTVVCQTVLVCVDGGLEVLLPELAGTVRTVRLQMLATAPTAQVRVPRPVYLRGGYEYWQQLPDGRLAVGGFRDVGGADEQTTRGTPTQPVQAALDRHLRERIGVTAAVTHRWAACVGYTASGLPFVGEVRPGVLAAGGYCGTGNLVGALSGRALAAMALAVDAPARLLAEVSAPAAR